MSVFLLSSTRIDALCLKNWTLENAKRTQLYCKSIDVVPIFFNFLNLNMLDWWTKHFSNLPQLHSRVTARNIMLPNCTRTYNNNNHFEGVTASRAFCDRDFTMVFIKQNKQFSDIGFFLFLFACRFDPWKTLLPTRFLCFFGVHVCELWVRAESLNRYIIAHSLFALAKH